MTFDEIAQNMTPTGRIAAIIGVVLCIAVIIIKTRARNLLREDEKAKQLHNPANKSSVGLNEMQPNETEHKSTFKTFVPGESECKK